MRHRWARLHSFVSAASIIASSMAAVGCSSSESGGASDVQGDTFDRNALLARYANDIALPAIRDFSDRAVALEASVTAWVGDTAVGSSAKVAAQQAWRAAMVAWQRLEVLQVGPLGAQATQTGGQDLRDRIYSWPTVNACRVDQKLATKAYESEGFFEGELVNVMGLDAIEYLLFRPDADNACAPQVEPNPGTWAALGADEIEKRRAEYAARLATEVARLAAEARQAWEPSGGAFADALANAGREGSPFPSAQAALDEVFAALWYAERQVKDMKVGAPAGLFSTCDADVCPDLVESPWADHGLENVRANLAAFRDVLSGLDASATDGVGFDDWLVARGAAELATEMKAEAEAALEAANALEGQLSALLVSNPESVRELHAMVKEVMDDLKTQFVSVLGLRVPEEGAGDND